MRQVFFTKLSKAGYSISVGPSVIASPKPRSSCIGIRALARVPLKRALTPS